MGSRCRKLVVQRGARCVAGFGLEGLLVTETIRLSKLCPENVSRPVRGVDLSILTLHCKMM